MDEVPCIELAGLTDTQPEPMLMLRPRAVLMR
jgi:hypothetical protein